MRNDARWADQRTAQMISWLGELPKAKAENLLERCVRKTINPSGKYESASGVRLDVERYPVCCSDVSDYGGCVALAVYLQFTFECACFFVVLFAAAVYPAVDSVLRNLIRNECRSTAEPASSCGLDGLAVRANTTNISWWMSPALGACEEYSNVTDVTHPFGKPDPFVAPAAGASSGTWKRIVSGRAAVSTSDITRLLSDFDTSSSLIAMSSEPSRTP